MELVSLIPGIETEVRSDFDRMGFLTNATEFYQESLNQVNQAEERLQGYLSSKGIEFQTIAPERGDVSAPSKLTRHAVLEKLIEIQNYNTQSINKKGEIIDLAHKMYGNHKFYDQLISKPSETQENPAYLDTAVKLYDLISSSAQPLTTKEMKQKVGVGQYNSLFEDSTPISEGTFYKALDYLKKRKLLKRQGHLKRNAQYALSKKGEGVKYFRDAVQTHNDFIPDPRGINKIYTYLWEKPIEELKQVNMDKTHENFGDLVDKAIVTYTRKIAMMN